MAIGNTNDEDEQSKPVGRPLKFQSLEELDAAIEQYLGDCAPHKSKHQVVMEKADGTNYWATVDVLTEQKPVTVAGAALALGVNRRTLLDYKERPEFLPSIERLLAACEAYTESMLYSNAANGAKFSLVNNFRGKYQAWADKQELTGGDGAPLMPIAMDPTILARRTSRTDGSAPPSSAADSSQQS